MSQKKDEDFKSFQIGQLSGFGPGARGGARKPAASSPAPAQAASSSGASNFTPPPPHPTAGLFPTIEALLESDEAYEALAAGIGETCQGLDELIAKRSGRVKQEAQLARQAFEHLFDLIDHLNEVKAQLLEQAGESQ